MSSLKWFMKQNPDRYLDAGYGWNPQTYSCAVKKGDQDWLNFVNIALREALTGVEFPAYAPPLKNGSARRLPLPRLASPRNSGKPAGG